MNSMRLYRDDCVPLKVRVRRCFVFVTMAAGLAGAVTGGISDASAQSCSPNVTTEAELVAALGLCGTAVTINIVNPIVATGVIDLTGHKVSMGSANQGFGGLTGTGIIKGNVISAADPTLTLNVVGTASFAGVIADGPGLAIVDVVKTGAGTQIFTGGNTYTGNTQVLGGALQLGDGTSNNGTINSTGSVTVSAGATLAFNYTGAQNFTNQFGGAGDVHFIAGTVTVTNIPNANFITGNTIIDGGIVKGGGDFVFGATSALVFNGAGTLDLNGKKQQFRSLASSGANGTVLDNSGGGAFFYLSGATSDTNFGGSLQDGAGFIIPIINYGTNTLTLSGTANTYSGSTTLSGGTLKGGAPNAFSANSSIHVGAGATLDIGGFKQTIGGLGDNVGAGGTVTNSGVGLNRTLTLGGNGNDDTFSGKIVDGAGTIAITKTGTGTLTFKNTNVGGFSNTYSGDTNIIDGTLAGSADNSFSPSSNVFIDKDTVGGTGGTLDTGGFKQTIKSLNDGSNGGGNVTNNSAGTTGELIVGGVNSSSSFSGVIADGAGIVALTKQGTGTLTLSGANTFTGDTTINGGTLKAGAAGAFSANSNHLVYVGGTLDLGGFDQTIAGLGDNGTDGGIVTNSGVLSPATLTLGGNNLDTIFSGQIKNGGSAIGITKEGTGTTTFVNVNPVQPGLWNTYSGDTRINNGTLKGGAIDSFSPLSNVFVDNTIGMGGTAIGTLDLGGFTQTIKSLSNGVTGGGIVTNNGAADALLYILNPAASTSFSGSLQDGAAGGALSRLSLVIGYGANTFTLSGTNNTYTGGTFILSGTLKGGAQNAFSKQSSVALNAGAKLDLAGNNQEIGALTDYAPGAGGTVTNSGDSVPNSLTLGGNGAPLSTFTGLIEDGLNGISIIKTGPGKQIFSGAHNTYKGQTSIIGGILSVGDDRDLGDNSGPTGGGVLLFLNNATLQVANGFSTGRNIFVANGGGTIDANGGSSTFNSLIQSGPGGSRVLTITDSTGAPGLVTLTNIGNTYDGGTLIKNSATLAVSDDRQLGAASGGLSFDTNGALRTTAGISSARTVTLLAGGGRIDAFGNSDTFSGKFTGPGSLTVTSNTPGGVIALTNTANDYQGGTLITNNMTLIAPSDAVLGNVNGDVSINGDGVLRTGNGFVTSRIIYVGDGPHATGFTPNGGVIDNFGGVATLNGFIAGTGQLTITDTSGGASAGLVTLTQTLNNYSGGTKIVNTIVAAPSDGVLGAPAGALTLVNGTLRTGSGFTSARNVTLTGTGVIDTNGGSADFSGAFGGTGGLSKVGAGRLNLTGSGTFTGASSVSAGLLSINGAFATPVTVNTGGALGGNGSIGGLNVMTGGALSPGNSIGTLTVNGNASFQNGSTYIVEVNAAGQGDLIIVTGTTTITGGIVQVLAQNGVYNAMTTYVIITSAGGVTGTFTGATSNLAFLTPTIGYTPTTVFLNLARNDINFGAASVAQGNAQGVGAAIQSAANFAMLTGANTQTSTTTLVGGGAGQVIINRLLGLTPDGARAAFNSLSGEAIADSQEVSFRADRLFTQQMTQAGAFWRGGGGGDPNGITIGGEAAQGALTDMSYGALARAQARSFRAWYVGYGGTRNLPGEAQFGSAPVQSRIFGGAGGLDYQIAPNFLIGAAAGGSESNLTVPQRSAKGNLDALNVGLYGVAKFDPVYVSGSLSYSHFTDRMSRTISTLGPAEKAAGRYTGDVAGGRIEIGAAQKFGSVTVTPFAAIEAKRINETRFAENSVLLAGGRGILGLNLEPRRSTALPASLGLQIEAPFSLGNGVEITPTLRAAWVHEFERPRRITASLQALPGASFIIEGARPPANAFALNAGLKANITPAVSLFASIDGEFARGSRAFAATGGLKILFDAASPKGAAAGPGSYANPATTLEAQAVFQRMVREPGNLELAFRYSELATESGDYEAAIGALERMVFFNPDLPRVHLELGVLYFRLGSYKQAQSHFDSAIASPSTPDDVRARVQEFQSEIGKRLAPNQFAFFAQTGLRFQSNANAGPNGLLVRALGENALLDPRFGRNSDGNTFALGTARHIFDFGNQRGDTWESQITLYGAKQFRQTRLDLGLIEVQTGPRLAVAPDALPGLTVRPYVVASAATLGNSPYLTTGGGGVALTYNVNPALTFEPSLEVRQRAYRNSSNYPGATDQNGTLVTAGLAGGGAIYGALRWQARTAFSHNRARLAADGYDQFSADIGMPMDFRVPVFGGLRYWTLTPAVGFTQTNYAAANALIDPRLKRQDNERRALLTLDAPLSASFGFSAQVSYARVNSNISNYDTRNLTFIAGPTARF